jgi:hypothetical protein
MLAAIVDLIRQCLKALIDALPDALKPDKAKKKPGEEDAIPWVLWMQRMRDQANQNLKLANRIQPNVIKP